jgi:hypothetical protein
LGKLATTESSSRVRRTASKATWPFARTIGSADKLSFDSMSADNGKPTTKDRWLLVAAVAVGIAIALVDARPTWDDTGITAAAMTLAAGILGFIGPRRPWVWALGVGIWIPAYAMSRAPSLGTLTMLAILAFPFAGAYLGMMLRRVITPVR